LGQTVVFIFALGAAVAQRDGDVRFPAPDYNCPEPNGRFADPEQCDKYYICKKGTAEAVLCNEGLLFDFSIPNHEKCVLPHNVKCGNRNLIQERTPGIDPRCEAANGIFNFDDPTVCDKYINCDKGRAFEMPCPAPLVFDIKVGSCVREAQLSEESRHCDEENEFLEIDGFSCPGTEAIGPQGLLQAHPIYPHPSDCRSYFTCYFGKEPNKFGCPEGQVFGALTQQCKPAEDVRECACWYSCDAATCEDCNVDCTCPTK
jgi:hypothetical protein